MPTVETTCGVATAKATFIITKHITQTELAGFNEAFKKLNSLEAELKPFQKEVDTFTAKVMELATGLDEAGYKALNPTDLAKLVEKRLKAKEFTAEPGLLDFCIKKTVARRNVKWQEEFVKVTSEAKALEILNATDETFCYKVVPVEATK